jgi:predicted amidophosphoribosyltransferase
MLALAQQHPSAIVVPVHAEESTGRNQIPTKFADYFGYVTGLEVDTGIVQSRKVGRTGKGAWHRLAFRPAFSGPVQAGREYIVVDDIVTGGVSLSELRQFIESQGGRVVAMTCCLKSK